MRRSLAFELVRVLLLVMASCALCYGDSADGVDVVPQKNAGGADASSRRVLRTTRADLGDQAVARDRTLRKNVVAFGSRESSKTLELYVRRMLALLCLGGAVCITVWCFAKRRQAPRHEVGDSLELVSTLALAPRCSVSLVRADGQSVLIARDASGVKELVLLPGGFESLLDTSAEQSSSHLPHAL